MYFYDQWVAAGVFVLTTTLVLTVVIAVLGILHPTEEE